MLLETRRGVACRRGRGGRIGGEIFVWGWWIRREQIAVLVFELRASWCRWRIVSLVTLYELGSNVIRSISKVKFDAWYKFVLLGECR